MPEHFRGLADVDELERLQEILRDGWEPFSTTTLHGGNVMVSFRRSAAAGGEVLLAPDSHYL